MISLGVDIGGSGIKAALVDTEKGKLVTERSRVDTPASLMPQNVIPAIVDLIKRFDHDGPVGMGFPAVVVDGCPGTPFTAHHIQEWVGYPVAQTVSEQLGRRAIMLNDADAAGIAEMRHGAGRKHSGTVIVLTLGTGIGSAMFVQGYLLPNTELGAIYLNGHTEYVEQYCAGRIKKEQKLKYADYGKRLDEYLGYLNHLFRPELFIIGGGISKRHKKYAVSFTLDTPVVPARMRNEAGIIGAAMAAIH